MAFDEQLQLADLLAPISGDNPVGPDLKFSNEFSEIELAHRQGIQAVPPTKPPGPPGPEAEEAFGRVVEIGSDFLLTKSKDLRVASYLAAALLRVGIGPGDDPFAARCFSGLRFGFELLRGMMDGFWDEMYPGLESRKASLFALASPDLVYPVRQVPLTLWGHGYTHYKEWATEADPGKPPADSDTLWSGNFQEAFEETDRDYYVRLLQELEVCTAALESLEQTGRDRFSEAGQTAPSYGDLKKALRDMTSAANQLLAKKPPEALPDTPPSEPVGEETGTEGAVAGETESPVGSGAAVAPAQPAASPAPVPPSAPPPASVEPQTPDQASAGVTAAARYLRREDARNPIPYLLLRSLRWGEVRGTGDTVDPKLLEAPRPDERKNLRGLLLEEKWEELLEATETVMASEAGRGWLDLQRYAILAADHMGAEYKAVTSAIRGALRSHLRDLPSLVAATLMDDSAAASSDTVQWLQAAGFVRQEGDAQAEDDLPDDTDPGRIRREASYAKARQMVQAGDPDGAIQLLMGRADREGSERASFVTRGEAARVMVERGEVEVARPILDELLREIEEHKLEDWEAGDVVAKPLGLLYRCLDPTEGPLRQQIYQRICRLDPLLAREIGSAGHAE